MTSIAAAREEWSRPPVDGVGYIPASELLKLSDANLKEIIGNLERTRYEGWRNHGGLWREVLGLDATRGQTVLDYGCGVGVEALQYVRADNRVWLADIVSDNVALAARVLRIHGYHAERLLVLNDDETDVLPLGSLDVIHCAGVLHHVPDPVPAARRMARWLRPDGELRLMLYSDRGWQLATQTEPPAFTTRSPSFRKFLRFYDQVGDHADWYSEGKIRTWFSHPNGVPLHLVRFSYLTPDDRYCAAVLRRTDA